MTFDSLVFNEELLCSSSFLSYNLTALGCHVKHRHISKRSPKPQRSPLLLIFKHFSLLLLMPYD